jgi:hypothetical protein
MKFVENMLRNTPAFFVFLGIINIFVFMGVNMIVNSYFDVAEIRTKGKEIVSTLETTQKTQAAIESELKAVEDRVATVKGTTQTLKELMAKKIWSGQDMKKFCQILAEENAGFKCPNESKAGESPDEDADEPNER